MPLFLILTLCCKGIPLVSTFLNMYCSCTSSSNPCTTFRLIDFSCLKCPQDVWLRMTGLRRAGEAGGDAMCCALNRAVARRLRAPLVRMRTPPAHTSTSIAADSQWRTEASPLTISSFQFARRKPTSRPCSHCVGEAQEEIDKRTHLET